MVRINPAVSRWLGGIGMKSDGFESLETTGITSAPTLASLNLECWKESWCQLTPPADNVG